MAPLIMITLKQCIKMKQQISKTHLQAGTEMDCNLEVVAKWPLHKNWQHEHPCPGLKKNILQLKAQISCNIRYLLNRFNDICITFCPEIMDNWERQQFTTYCIRIMIV